MKKYILLALTLLFALAQIETVEAQFRPFLEPVAVPDDDGPNHPGSPNSPGSPGNQPILDPFGRPMPGCCENGNEFDFPLFFNDLGVLIALENAIARAQRAAVEQWLRQQEETFRQEINRQLGSNHRNFKDAQRAFFKRYEENYLRINRAASSLASKELQQAREIDNAQLQTTEDFFLARQWEFQRLVCLNLGGLPDCIALQSTEVRGGTLGERWRRTSDLDKLLGEIEKDFSEQELDAANRRACRSGLLKIISDGSLSNRFVNNHIEYYDHKGLQDRVELMIAYLTVNNVRPPLRNPVAHLIPQFWDDRTLKSLGKENAPNPGLDVSVFNNTFLQNVAKGYLRPSIPPSALQSLLDRRERIIQQHIDRDVDMKPWFLDNDGDGFHSRATFADERPGSQWKTTTKGRDCDDLRNELTRNCGFNLNDPCANKDLRNKTVDSRLNQQICDRKQRVSVPRGGSALSKSFRQQTIENGFGKINVDQYELNILKLPTGMTPQQLFEEIRLNFDELITGGNIPLVTEVQFEPYSQEDGITWNSSNPLGAAMDFDTPFDTSTVIATEYSLEDTFWTFTTYRSIDHLGHFVSGHRQFRLRYNNDGTFTFLIRGADRLGQLIDLVGNSVGDGDFLFRQAGDKTWKNVMKSLQDFITSKPGSRTGVFNKNREYGKRHVYNENDCLD